MGIYHQLSHAQSQDVSLAVLVSSQHLPPFTNSLLSRRSFFSDHYSLWNSLDLARSAATPTGVKAAGVAAFGGALSVCR